MAASSAIRVNPVIRLISVANAMPHDRDTTAASDSSGRPARRRGAGPRGIRCRGGGGTGRRGGGGACHRGGGGRRGGGGGGTGGRGAVTSRPVRERLRRRADRARRAARCAVGAGRGQ